MCLSKHCQPFLYGISEKTPHLVGLTRRLGYGGHILDFNPGSPRGYYWYNKVWLVYTLVCWRDIGLGAAMKYIKTWFKASWLTLSTTFNKFEDDNIYSYQIGKRATVILSAPMQELLPDGFSPRATVLVEGLTKWPLPELHIW